MELRREQVERLRPSQRFHLARLIERRDSYAGMSIAEMLDRMEAVDRYVERVVN